MRITVFGAAGNVSSRIVREALDRGHEVTAVMRNLNRAHELPKGVKAVAGDASKVEDIRALGAGQDLIITATRPQQGQEHELAEITHAFMAALKGSPVRLLLVGGAGGLVVPNSQGRLVVDDPQFVPLAWRDIAVACTEQLEICRNSNLVNWSYLSPAANLAPGERTGQFRLGLDELILDELGQSSVSMEDLAVAMLNEAEQPQHINQRFTVGY
ncbi:MAG: NAD(P)H-binding protein [Bermanella sp.]